MISTCLYRAHENRCGDSRGIALRLPHHQQHPRSMGGDNLRYLAGHLLGLAGPIGGWPEPNPHERLA